MKTFSFIHSLLSILLVVLPYIFILIGVAFTTIFERKILASSQRRVGPNTVGFYGVLQPFADALKLIIKETVIPAQSNKFLFYVAPVVTLFFSLLGWVVIPFGQGIMMFDFPMSLLFSLTLSSLGIYGVLFAGWSANSKYGFLGSLRSTASMISYELILSSTVLIIVLIVGSLNYSAIIDAQQSIMFIIPLFTVFILYFISILAETSRVPFDLQEAESELVAGFFVEHAAIIFVFFFLSEYSSIVLFSVITAILYLGGYNLDLFFDLNFINNFDSIFKFQGFILGFKGCLGIFAFIWFRSTLPRVRFDQILFFCWTNLLPLVMALLLFIPLIIVFFNLEPFVLNYSIYLN